MAEYSPNSNQYQEPQIVGGFIQRLLEQSDDNVFASSVQHLSEKHDFAELFPYSNATDLYPVRKLIVESARFNKALYEPSLELLRGMVCNNIEQEVLLSKSCYCMDPSRLRALGFDPDFILMLSDTQEDNDTIIWHSKPDLYSEYKKEVLFTTLGRLAERSEAYGGPGLYLIDNPVLSECNGNLRVVAPGLTAGNVKQATSEDGAKIELSARKASNLTGLA